MKIIFIFLGLVYGFVSFSQFSGNQTPTYPKLIQFYDSLSQLKQIELYNMGQSDYGLPIYLCVLNGEKDSTQTFHKFQQRGSVFINNGIHPGEPDGINACGKITLEYINHTFKMDPDVTLAFILCYNVGGMMNRNSHSRANQNGPEEYGFRGNAQNLDLNRDFIKMDSKNAFTFAKIFHAVNPYIFIDTHVSNGADYQYTLTLIHSLKERLLPEIRQLSYQYFIPDLEKAMRKYGIDVFPYVELTAHTPDKGIEAFNDLPRYAMGYASLFPCISITTETHMLKPFEQRVEATYWYLKEVANWAGSNFSLIQESKQKAISDLKNQTIFKYNYQRTQQRDSILFKGFDHGYKKSLVTGLDRLYYDRTKPYTKYIPYYKHYQALSSTQIPEFYVVSAQCTDVLERLKQNNVQYQTITQDSLMELTFFRVKDYESGNRPYEGHFLHQKIKVEEQKGNIQLKRGDLLIPTQQSAKTFICSVLEPEAEDSYFAWNFFDSYIQEKEYFSDYVFEDLAVEILNQDVALRSLFEEKKKNNPQFAESQWEQLYFIYQNSIYFEASFMRLPIYKIY